MMLAGAQLGTTSRKASVVLTGEWWLRFHRQIRRLEVQGERTHAHWTIHQISEMVSNPGRVGKFDRARERDWLCVQAGNGYPVIN
jgi:hypothetical protein